MEEKADLFCCFLILNAQMKIKNPMIRAITYRDKIKND